MRAACWNGVNDVRVETVPDPEILNPRDAIVRVTTAAICGSDLHLYDGYIPTMKKGDIMGHEFMGEVVEVGRANKDLKVGDRVVVPFCIGCGECYYCQNNLWSLCDNSNPNAVLAEKAYGYTTAGLFGYSHMTGGYAGGQAQFVRVPFADVNTLKVNGLPDEQVLFLGDIFPTGYMAAENCDIKPGDTVAVWGCGPVAQFAIQSAWMLGAERVIAIDRLPERLLMAQTWGRAEVIDFEQVDSVIDTLRDMTGGNGPDACVDAVGMEAHGASSFDAMYDRAKQAMRLETDRPHALREALMACRKGGTVSIPGVYGGLLDKVPFGAAFQKGLTLKMGQTHVHRYMKPLLERIERGDIDPSMVITHSIDLEDAPEGYETFKHKEDTCIKVVVKPNGPTNGHHRHSHGPNGHSQGPNGGGGNGHDHGQGL
jgi:threonine dehydrogenase-like Zn-dependent dehydrogenase